MTAAGMITAGATAPGAAAGEAPRIDLKVLVVDNGDSPVKAVTAQLRSTGIPYTTVAAGTLDGREAFVPRGVRASSTSSSPSRAPGPRTAR
jgi:hypothetical protein